jgi:branched-chain amino acid transport system substrate-binding protein
MKRDRNATGCVSIIGASSDIANSSRGRSTLSTAPRRYAAKVLASLLGLLAIAGGAPVAAPLDVSNADERRITIGLLNPVTGPFAQLGQDVNDGFELYIVERGGSLAGYAVDLVFEDEANDPATAMRAAERLVERAGADVLVGFVNSEVAYATAGYIVERGVPLIITVAGANDLTQRAAADNIFRVSYTSSQDTLPMGTYACKALRYERVAVVALDYAFGWEGAGGFARAYEDAGCTVIQEIYVPLGTREWAPFVQRIDGAADAVFALVPGADAIRFVQAYRDAGVQAPLIGSGTLTDEEVLEQMGELAAGVVTTLHYSAALDTDANRAFVAAFEEAYGRPASRYVEGGYTAALVLDAALARIDGELSSAAITAALGGVEVEAPRGPIRFDEYGQAVYNVYVRQVREVDGEWRNVVIDSIEEVSQFWTYEPDEYLGFPRYEHLKGGWSTN